MKLRGPTGIVLLAFAAGLAAWLGGHLLRAPVASNDDVVLYDAAGDVIQPPPGAGAPPLNRPGDTLVGQLWVDLQLPDPQGQSQRLSQWQGQRVLLNFWATWCAPCREEMPRLRAAQAEYGEYGVQIIGIAVDTPAAVRTWLAQHPSNYPILLDEPQAHRAASAYGNPGVLLPYNVLVDATGIVRRQHFGALDTEQLTAWLRPPSKLNEK